MFFDEGIRRLCPRIIVCGFVFANVLMTHTCVAQDPPQLVKVDSDAVKDESIVGDTHAAFENVIQGDFSGIVPLLEKYWVPVSVSLLLIVFGYLAATAIGRLVGAAISDKVDITLGRFAGKLVTNLLLLFVFLGVLGKFGFNVTSLTAVLAASGFAIGMALQGALGNFAAGIMLLVFRPFKVGDLISVAGSSGVVDEIDLFTTRLNTLDNRHLILPNGSVFGSTIENFTHNRVRRVDVSVGVAYDADIRQTRQVLENATAIIPGAVPDPAPQVVLVDLGDSAVNWQVRVWARPDNYLEVKERLTAATKEALDAANIGIPFPQMDIHLAADLLQAMRRAA